MKSIVHIIPRFTTGGAERLVLQYGQLLNTKKYHLHVVSSVDDGDLRPAFERAGIPVFVGSRSTHGGRVGAYRAVRTYLEKIQPALIHSHLFGGDLVASQLVRHCAQKPKWISTIHNIRAQESWLRRAVWKRLLPRADRVIAVSRQVDDFVANDLHLDPSQRVCIPNGIDTAHFERVPPAIFVAKTLRLATVGRLETQKGHTYLFDALAALPQAVHWSLDIFGDGALREELHRKALRLGIADSIRWHGVVGDMVERYPNVDVVLQPSLWEGMSLVVMEAMAAGRVVVATPVAAAELIEDKKTGFVVPVKNPQALAKAIQEIAEDKEKALSVAKHARNHAREHFSIRRHIATLEALYDEVLAG